MRHFIRRGNPGAWGAAALCACLVVPFLARAASLETPAAAPARAYGGAYGRSSYIADSTWVDHDDGLEAAPPDEDPGTLSYFFRESMVEPISRLFDIPDKLISLAGLFGARTDHQAANVNAYDEVPNSSWFTNRNAMRSISVADLLQGPDSVTMPETPWTVTGWKKGGMGLGFTIKDAAGRKWAVEFDPPDHAQLCSGADVVSRTILHAAGYNVPHNEPVRFTRRDLVIDPKLLGGAGGEAMGEAEFDTLLTSCAVFPDGRYAAKASLWLPGHVLGSPDSRGLRRGDADDWYHHENRRESRGLYVVSSWIGHWDTKDPNLLDTFTGKDGARGHVVHYLLDCDEALGASATQPKALMEGYEKGLDWGWVAKRMVTLGFVVEPWRKAHQVTGMPSVGNFCSDHFEPGKFAEYQNAAMHEMTDRDAYWGAKIVASFSDAQVAAVVDAAHYDDPRARDYLVKTLIERRDMVVRHWFAVVAPLDFFTVHGGALRFHDLAVDVGLAGPRGYDVELESGGGREPRHRHLHLDRAELNLQDIADGATELKVDLTTAEGGARPARVELTRRDSTWIVTKVRHG